MKKSLLFLFLIGIFSSGFSQWQNNNDRGQNNNGQYNYSQNSALIVSANTQNSFTVMVDNGYQYQSNGNNGYGNTVNVGSLSAGNHTIAVYEWKTNLFGKQKQRQLYNTALYFKPGVETTININGFGQVSITERQLYQNNDNGYGNNGNGRGYGYGNQRKHHKKHGNDREDEGNYKRDDDRNLDDRNSDDRNDNRNNNWNNDGGQYNNQYNKQGMNAQTFEQFKQSLRNEGFDNTKLSMAKQVISGNYFTSAQVKEIMQLMIFEPSKLEIAKYAYRYTVDKGSYFLVNDAFTYSSSKDELMQYIQANK